ncbi:MAG: 2-phospho-L-lactate guanylyltransferase [Tepidiformaceae bacterium]
MRITALVPVKPPTASKARLAEILSPDERAALARVTFRTVAEALFGASVPCVILTPNALHAAEVTQGRAAIIEEDPVLNGLNAQLEWALAGDALAGSDAVLILHADLPLATAGAIRRLLAAAKELPAGVTMVESADGGTNAMVLPMPLALPLSYGRNSHQQHREAAAAARFATLSLVSPDLALDLDTAADIHTLLQSAAGRKSAAGQLLLGMGIDSRLATRG